MAEAEGIEEDDILLSQAPQPPISTFFIFFIFIQPSQPLFSTILFNHLT
jgi:hypothetical protein